MRDLLKSNIHKPVRMAGSVSARFVVYELSTQEEFGVFDREEGRYVVYRAYNSAIKRTSPLCQFRGKTGVREEAIRVAKQLNELVKKEGEQALKSCEILIRRNPYLGDSEKNYSHRVADCYNGVLDRLSSFNGAAVSLGDAARSAIVESADSGKEAVMNALAQVTKSAEEMLDFAESRAASASALRRYYVAQEAFTDEARVKALEELLGEKDTEVRRGFDLEMHLNELEDEFVKRARRENLARELYKLLDKREREVVNHQ